MPDNHTITLNPETPTQTTPNQRAAEKEDFLRTMNPVLRQVLEKIESFFTDLDAKTLVSRHELGSLAKQVLEEAEQTGGCCRYGQAAWGRLLAALGQERARELKEAVRFARAYTRAEVDELSRMRLADGRSLSYSLLRLLASVLHATQRQRLLERTIAESLTADELAKLVQDQFGRPKTARDNKPKAPTSLDEAVRQQAGAAEEILNRAGKAWDGPEHSLSALAQRVPPEQVTWERAESLRQVAVKLREMARVAEEKAQEAERAYEQFIAALDRREREGDADGAAHQATASPVAEEMAEEEDDADTANTHACEEVCA